MQSTAFSRHGDRSVDVGLRQFEGVPDDVESWTRFLDDNFHDVETEQDVRVVQQPQPGQRAAGDQLLFVARHGFSGRSVAEAAPGFDLHEDKRIAGPVPADEIDLAAVRRAKIPVENLVAVPAEMALGEALAFAPEPLVLVLARLRRAREAPAERGEKFSDGSDKAHARGV